MNDPKLLAIERKDLNNQYSALILSKLKDLNLT